MQYRFGQANASLRSYIGAGPTYAKFFGERGTATLTALTNPGGPGTQLSVDSKLAATVQAGLALKFSDQWFMDDGVQNLSQDPHASIDWSDLDAKLNPTTVSIGIGSKF